MSTTTDPKDDVVAFAEEALKVEVAPWQKPVLRRIMGAPPWTPAGYWCRVCLRMHRGPHDGA